MSPETKKNVILAAASFLVALIVAEVALRIIDPVRPADRVEFMVDDATYWRVRPNQIDRREPIVSVNSQGFRGPSVAGDKQPGRPRIFLLGDSYTWGFGVGDEETYAAQLQSMSDERFDVINGGTPGWGVFQFEARLRRWIEQLEPDVVAVFVNTADILRQPYGNADVERDFLRRSRLRNNIRRFSKIVTVIYRLVERYRLQTQNRQVANAVPMDNVGGVRPELYDELLERDIARLADMLELTRLHGARFVLIAWPQRIPTNEAFLTAMQGFASQWNIDYIDMTAALADHDYDSYTLPGDHHPSALGHRLIAEQLLRQIEN